MFLTEGKTCAATLCNSSSPCLLPGGSRRLIRRERDGDRAEPSKMHSPLSSLHKMSGWVYVNGPRPTDGKGMPCCSPDCGCRQQPLAARLTSPDIRQLNRRAPCRKRANGIKLTLSSPNTSGVCSCPATDPNPSLRLAAQLLHATASQNLYWLAAPRKSFPLCSRLQQISPCSQSSGRHSYPTHSTTPAIPRGADQAGDQIILSGHSGFRPKICCGWSRPANRIG